MDPSSGTAGTSSQPPLGGQSSTAQAGQFSAGAASAAATGASAAGSGANAAGSGAAGTGSRGGTAGTSSPAAGSGNAAAGSGGAVAGSGGAAAGRGGATAGSGGATAGSGGAAAGSGGAAAGSGGGTPTTTEKFSFFVTSWAALQRLSKSPNGFGGDLRYGQADGLSGADKICREIAETSMPGAGTKTWRAFLSVTKGPDGQPVHALDRVGAGPWYDRQGRLVAQNKADLGQQRPKGADAAIINDLPNEDGVPNHAPDGELVDNHDMLTGTNETGQLFSTDWKFTCHDWTSAVGSDGTPRVGHSWPRGGGGGGGRGGGMGGMGSGANWMSALNEAGCAAGASLIEMGPPMANNPTVGSGGGYGGFYCFALQP